MRRPSRLLLLRIAAFVGLGFSALLTAEALRPERKFCPVDEACAAARSSALGSVLGIPTSLLGLLAFAGFLAVTFVPRAQRGWRAAGALAALAGLGFLAYQTLALDAFCPLCVVADLMGVALGVLAFVGGPVPAAPVSPRMWIPVAAVAALVIALPLAWPHAARPAWSPIVAPVPGAGSPGSGSPAAGAPGAPSPVVSPRISLVEYLNPFCAHCRATHARLAHVLEDVKTPVERVRLYTWSGKTPPLWAKACVCAHDQGGGTDLERPFFRELLQARSDRPAEIWAAGERAGLDVAALRACVSRGDADERLGRVYARVKAASISGLPTLDLGKRRLEGEQTEEELRDAVAAAEADLRSRTARDPPR